MLVKREKLVKARAAKCSIKINILVKLVRLVGCVCHDKSYYKENMQRKAVEEF